MTKNTRKKATTSVRLPRMTTTALKGKQTVRTSFKLSEACIHAINIVSTQLGLKHRSLFDYLVEDIDTLKTIAVGIINDGHKQNEKTPKSYIISRETQKKIDDMCDDIEISRDTLIEHSVRRLLPIIEKEIENHRKRKDMLALVRNHFRDSKSVLNQIKESVGAEDPIYRVFENTVTICEQAKAQISDIISKGKVLEGFDPESLKN